MASFLEHSYSIVHQDNTADQPTTQELKTQLEKGTDESKVETMKRILTIMLSGDPMPLLLMHIIRFVMPSKSKPLKKLLYLYYEICPKLDAAGKLKQEMILVWYVQSLWSIFQKPNTEYATATEFEMTFNILTNIFVAILFVSYASFENPSSLNHCYPPLDRAWNIGMRMYERTLSLQLPRYTSYRKHLYQTRLT